MNRPKDYTDSPAYAQSDLTLFEKDIRAFHLQKIMGVEAEDTQTDYFDLGSIIDCLLLEKECFKDRYFVTAQVKASGKIKDVIDKVWQLDGNEEPRSQSLDDCRDMIITAMDQLEYQKNWRTDTRLAKVMECEDYWQDLILGNGKHIVSMEIYTKALQILDSLKDDEFTGNIFAMLNGELPEGIELVTAAALYADDDPLKGLLDFYFEDHINHSIEPWDLKTAKNLGQFRSNYRKHRYGRQGAVYTHLLKRKYQGWKVNDFNFLVIPTESNELPERFTMDPQDLIAFTEGCMLPSGGEVKGWKTLLRDIQWHQERGLWNHTRAYYEANGRNILKTVSMEETVEEAEIVLF
jgi:hypothetical protein